MKKIASAHLGCKVSAYDAEAMTKLFIDAGYEAVDFNESADVYLINTCALTNLSDRKSRQLIRRAVKKNPDAIIIAAGCYTQMNPETAADIPGVSLVVGTNDRQNIVSLAENCRVKNETVIAVTDVTEANDYENLSTTGLRNRTRAFLKIGDGCDNFCSYCIVPFARGRVRSRNPRDILTEAEFFAREGFKEIVVAGIEVASYGKDLSNIGLADVLELISSVGGIERIRLSSVPCDLFTENFIGKIKKLPKICAHFHLSLQSGCDETLKRMNRKYTASDYRDTVSRILETYPCAGLTTDIIAGFPGETDNDFDESYSFCAGIPFLKMHVFPYSPRAGTSAASFDGQVNEKVKRRRCERMIALSDELGAAFKTKYIGKTMPVLFEKKTLRSDDIYEGYTDNYIRVRRRSDEDLSGRIVEVTINRSDI